MKEKLIKTGAFIDNEYLDLYCELIKKNLHTKKEKYKTQAHHIVPRYTKLNIEDKVNLSHKDHCLAHYYLYFCSSNDKYKFANERALSYTLGQYWMFCDKDEIINKLDRIKEIKRIAWNKGLKATFEQKAKLSKSHIGLKQTQETINKRIQTMITNGNYRKPMDDKKKKVFTFQGHKHSDESNEKNRLSHLGKKMSYETRLKQSLAHKGKPAHNKGKPMSEEAKLKAKATWAKKRELKYAVNI